MELHVPRSVHNVPVRRAGSDHRAPVHDPREASEPGGTWRGHQTRHTGHTTGQIQYVSVKWLAH